MTATPLHVSKASSPGQRWRAAALLAVFCLHFAAATPGWAQDAPGPPVAEPNLPPPPETPPPEAPAPVAPGPGAPAPGAPAPAPTYAPVAGPDAPGSPEQAAMLDAEADTNSALWFGAGCLLSWVGVLVAYVAEPAPPFSRMVGKPPEYVGRYVRVYAEAGRSEQTRMALFGCGTTLVGYAAVMVFALSNSSGGI